MAKNTAIKMTHQNNKYPPVWSERGKVKGRKEKKRKEKKRKEKKRKEKEKGKKEKERKKFGNASLNNNKKKKIKITEEK